MSVKRILTVSMLGFLALMMLVVSGCASADRAQNGAIKGSILGAVAGAVFDVATAGKSPIRGAAIGALIGGGIGAVGGAMDKTPRYSRASQPRTTLSFAERGVVILNNAPYAILVRVSGIRQDRTISIPSLGRGAIRLAYAGGERFLIVVMKQEAGGKISGIIDNYRIRFQWGHYVGSGYNSNRNHKMLEFDGRRLQRI